MGAGRGCAPALPLSLHQQEEVALKLPQITKWTRLLWNSMEVFENLGDEARRDMVSGHGGNGLRVGPETLLVFCSLNDSVILCNPTLLSGSNDGK